MATNGRLITASFGPSFDRSQQALTEADVRTIITHVMTYRSKTERDAYIAGYLKAISLVPMPTSAPASLPDVPMNKKELRRRAKHAAAMRRFWRNKKKAEKLAAKSKGKGKKAK